VIHSIVDLPVICYSGHNKHPDDDDDDKIK